ncbi:MAG: CHAT domain-containing protein [Rubrivivax sp.]
MPSTPDTRTAQPITFQLTAQVRRGGASPVASGAAQGQLKARFTLAAERSGGQVQQVQAVDGQDLVVLHIDQGPALVLNPETARELLQGQATAQRSGGASGVTAVPLQLNWGPAPGAGQRGTRGVVGRVLLKGLEVLTGVGTATAADFVASAAVRHLDGACADAVCRLRRDALPPLKDSGSAVQQIPTAPTGAATLVLVHGTFVDTVSTFGKLWTLHREAVDQLFDAYGDRVYALDHPTLGVSPITNALKLARALPAGARVHLLTHSRGGLVAEVLARVAGLVALRGEGPALTEDDLGHFSAPELTPQRADLLALAEALQGRDIQITRVLRVACPARGTLLASRRLDAYLSVLRWGLERSGLPVLPELVGFLSEVARVRADPQVLPGLAAQMPDSPLVRWLNQPEPALPGQLRVLAGDLQGDTLGGWLKTLLSDAFYWTDNDIVVQTRSMYGGAPRAQPGDASFVLERSGRTDHFNYFANPGSVQTVLRGLTETQPAGFAPIGLLSWAGQDTDGLRGRHSAHRDPRAGTLQPQLPAVFVLPGILGSHLAAGGDRVWLSWRLLGGLKRLAYTGERGAVLPDGAIGMVYDDLMDHLAPRHEVVEFAFDWRLPIEAEAERLAAAMAAALDARADSGQPVRLLAHSMGGVLARTVQLVRPDLWQRWLTHPDARLLMLGTPNGGSWAPMQVLSGDDTFGNTLAALGSPLQDRQARQLMAQMPGFLQLQAGLLDDALGLARQDTWQRLARDDEARAQAASWWHRHGQADGDSATAAYAWGVPPQAVLDQARRLRQRLDDQRDHELPAFAHRLLLVVGRSGFTPDGFELGEEGLVYLNASAAGGPGGAPVGDGRVPLPLALLPGVRTWQLDSDHGALPDTPAAFAAFEELLTRGDTQRLPVLSRPAQRDGGGAAAPAVLHRRSRPARGLLASRPASGGAGLFSPGLTTPPEGSTSDTVPPLRLRVRNGDLSFIDVPLMLGHYNADQLTGSEAVVDRLIGGAMHAALGAGLYPHAPGSCQVFVNREAPADNPWRHLPRPRAVVVVGLGDEGRLGERELALSVRQGVLAWAQRLAEGAGTAPDAEGDSGPGSFELAATLLGSGGVGLNSGAVARAIARGALEANQRLHGSGWPRLAQLHLVELYLERASEAWQDLRVLATAMPQHFELADEVDSGPGALQRPVEAGYRGTDHELVSALAGPNGLLCFTMDSRRARSELRGQATQLALVRHLVHSAAQGQVADPQLGRTLFQLLVPVEVEPFLSASGDTVLELDEQTAPIPWELLDTPTARGSDLPASTLEPWAIRSRLLRRLRSSAFRAQVLDARADDPVLVIGEPQVNPQHYARLPGAVQEARSVAQALLDSGLPAEQLHALCNHDPAFSIINAWCARAYRIVHIAGHGEALQKQADGSVQGGVVLSGGTFLGPAEVRAMRVVPELVFINCCHGAARDTSQVLSPPGSPAALDPGHFAASLADELIAAGVRCVVAAGWAVDDEAATAFADTFYRQLLAGQRFAEAVTQARRAARALGGHTWAAYQCYGDPGWTYARESQAAQATQRPSPPIASSTGLCLALAPFAHGGGSAPRLETLTARFGPRWGHQGRVAEAFGRAWLGQGRLQEAQAWFDRAVAADDAGASGQAAEQAANLRARLAWEQLPEQPSGSALAAARQHIEAAVVRLDLLKQLHASPERLSLLGSAWKRLALMEGRAAEVAGADGRAPASRLAERAALQAARAAYAQAETLAAHTPQADQAFYAGLNRCALDLCLALGDPDAPEPLPALVGVQALGERIARAVAQAPDFWSVLAQQERALLLAVHQAQLATHAPTLAAAYADAHRRAPAVARWKSVADQARLVLGAYRQRPGRPPLAHAEAQAVDTLLAQLQTYAADPA